MVNVAAVQLTASSSIEDNLTPLHAFFKKAKDEAVKLIVLPENFALMASRHPQTQQYSEPFGVGVIQEHIRQLAKFYQLWVIAGTIPITGRQTKIRSSCLVFDQKGACVARYDKIHLFDVHISSEEVHKESATIEPGDEVVVIDTPIGRVGLTVCYDLRFPELYRQLALKGADVFAVPSAFTAVTGRAHWETLLRARAIENQCYVVSANQVGHHDNGRDTYGHSLIIDPWGKIMAQQESDIGIITANIDLEHLKQLRNQFPTHAHHVLHT